MLPLCYRRKWGLDTMSSTDIPAPLRPASPTPASILGPYRTAAQRISDRLAEIDTLCAQVRELGGHDELFTHLAQTLIDMRLEGEALKQRVGLPNASDALSRIRSAGALRAKEVRALA